MPGYGRVPTRVDSDVVGSRIAAAIVDSIVGIVVYFLLAALFLGGAGATGDEGAAAGGFFISFFILPFAVFTLYYLLLEGLWDGYTIGKKVMGIKVVKESGGQISVGDSLLRNILRFIDGLFYYLVGFVFMAMSDRKQRLGDRIASTVVVTDTPAANPGSAQQGHQQQQPNQQGGQAGQPNQQQGGQQGQTKHQGQRQDEIR